MSEWVKPLVPATATRRSAQDGSVGRHGNWMEWTRRHGEAAAAAVCGLLILAAWLWEEVSGAVSPLLYLAAYVSGGFPKAREGILVLVKKGKLDVNLLMVFAGAGAAAIGHWMEGALLIFIFALSGALESYSEQRSRRDLTALMSLKPESAWLWTEEGERRVSIQSLSPGDVVVVKPGERVPVDGAVSEGRSEVDQSAVTGESVPVEKEAGSRVFSGTLNGQGCLFIRVERTAEESTFSRILRLVEEAKEQEPPSQRRIERMEGMYAWGVSAATLFLILLPPLLLGWTWSEAVYRGMVFLVVASPCAVVTSIMPAVLSAMSRGARIGLLFKGGVTVQALGEARAVAFDKTGTLTRGQLRVTDVVSLHGGDEDELLAAAASIECLSEHPIARAILQTAKERGLPAERPESFRSRTGYGVEAEWRGGTWRLGKPAWLLGEEGGAELCRLEGEGKTVVCIRGGDGAAGLIALRDTVRPEAKAVVRRLQEWGIRVVMLTGDRRQTAEAIAREAGIDDVEAELLPEEKVEAIRRLRREAGSAVMVGDGVNDAPALAAADVGVAMGAAGSDVALETARVVLMNDDLNRFADAIDLGKRTGSIVKQNLIFAAAVIACLVTANFIGGIPLPFGVIGHEGSTLLVILNGLRMLR